MSIEPSRDFSARLARQWGGIGAQCASPEMSAQRQLCFVSRKDAKPQRSKSDLPSARSAYRNLNGACGAE
jgi:hypothetical protein